VRSIARQLGVSLSSASVWTRGIQDATAPLLQPDPPPPDPQGSSDTRVCGRCHRDLALTDFHRQQSRCKQCRAEYIRNRGELHLRQTRAARDRRRAEARRYVLGLLTAAECADCGLADPLVLEFDHIGKKTAGVSLLVHEGYGLARIQAGIACCEVVCANCHRRRTTLRAGGSWRLDLDSHVPTHRSIQRRNLRFVMDHLLRSACVSCGEGDVVVLNSTTRDRSAAGALSGLHFRSIPSRRFERRSIGARLDAQTATVGKPFGGSPAISAIICWSPRSSMARASAF
jgi:hypothetical protein